MRFCFLREDNIYFNSNNNLNGDKNSNDKLYFMNELNKLKNVFLDNMSHELRTPITVILGYAGLLFEELKDPELKEMARIILQSSNRLTESLNLLLDQSDVESNKLKINLKQYNIFELLKNAYYIHKPLVEGKNLIFNFEYGQKEIYCDLDKNMFEKVTSNLLKNAIKFTDKGSISLKLSLSQNISGQRAVIQITDTGIGIPEEKLSLIFEAFRQVSEGMNRVYQGIGLGLSVTKKFVELMNGEIDVSSKLNYGTTFTIIFPVVTNLKN